MSANDILKRGCVHCKQKGSGTPYFNVTGVDAQQLQMVDSVECNTQIEQY